MCFVFQVPKPSGVIFCFTPHLNLFVPFLGIYHTNNGCSCNSWKFDPDVRVLIWWVCNSET